MKRISHLRLLALAAMMGAASCGPALAAPGGVAITEWMYQGNGTGGLGEFVELTNFGASAVDFTGWSFDDNSRAPGSQSLSGFGVVAAGESVIFTELSATAFRSDWSLSSDVKVISIGASNNLGRSDEINIYNSASILVDRLTFNDAVAGPRTQGTSGVPGSLAAIAANNPGLWKLSAINDTEHSYASTLGEIGSPGTTLYAIAAVPEPGTYALVLAGLGLVGLAKRRRGDRGIRT